ncbi:MAG: thiosulfate oxidation carrier protein SoxY [Gallionella sp.]|jgi:sulfur-oxidizing protein SoxY|nr:thiosulfate oxidation carrier protein SoxY [Gallionella sp.]
MKAEVDLNRRKALKAGGSMGLLALFGGLGLLQSGAALAEWNKAAFSAKSMDDALNALGVIIPENSATAIQLTVPEIAENGSVVPVSVASNLADIEQISILVDKNPNVLAASFVIPQGTEGLITTRVKMGQTANVIALVKAGGKYYRVAKEVKVTAGGCGG